jgi:RNase P subunit RPR2
MKNKKEELQQAVASALAELITFETKGNKSAGRRARKYLSTITKLCKELRVDVQNEIKASTEGK